MFQGILLFGIAALLVIVAFFVMRSRREAYEETVPPEDRLTDEEFRRIEFGEDE